MKRDLSRLAIIVVPVVLILATLSARPAHAEDEYGFGRVGLGFGVVSGDGLDSGLFSSIFGFEVTYFGPNVEPRFTWGLDIELDLVMDTSDLLFAVQPFALATVVADASDPASVPSLAIGVRTGVAFVADSTYLPLEAQISFRWHINVGLVFWVDLPVGPAFKLGGAATSPGTVFVFTPRVGISFIFV